MASAAASSLPRIDAKELAVTVRDGPFVIAGNMSRSQWGALRLAQDGGLVRELAGLWPGAIAEIAHTSTVAGGSSKQALTRPGAFL